MKKILYDNHYNIYMNKKETKRIIEVGGHYKKKRYIRFYVLENDNGDVIGFRKAELRKMLKAVLKYELHRMILDVFKKIFKKEEIL